MWKKPKLLDHQIVGITSFEATPFVFHDRIYLLENFHRSAMFPQQPPQYRFHEDGCLIRDLETDTILAYPWLNHYFSTVTVHENEIWLFGGDYGWNQPWWEIRELQVIRSRNLTSWSEPEVVLRAGEGEHLFNNAVVYNGHSFIMLYETDDLRWPKFTFRFAESHDLIHWEKLPENAIYGQDKYVGGPALYFVDGFYYVLYLAALGNGCWETRITRSRNLIDWEDAPPDRPFLTFDPSRETDPAGHPGVMECNASDAELIVWHDEVHIWRNGGDQLCCGDLQRARFTGTLKQLLEAYFEK